MPVFVLQFVPVFRGAEVPGFWPEIPAPRSSAQAPEVPAHIFFRGFLLSLFDVSLWRGPGILYRKYPRKFPGVRKFWSMVRKFRFQENLAKSFSRFLSGGGPDLCTGGLLRKFPEHRKFRCKHRKFRYLTPEFPAPRCPQRVVFGGGYK